MSTKFQYKVEEFADIKILRYQVPGFEQLTPKQKQLLYYLAKAGHSGRDIIWDQNFKYGIFIRKVLEHIVRNYSEEKDGNWGKFMEYVKRVWVSNGIHHHYSDDKLIPEFDRVWFEVYWADHADEINNIWTDNGGTGTCPDIGEIIFNPNLYPKKTNNADGIDTVCGSCVNFYDGVTQQEVEDFYKNKNDPDPDRPLSHGLNSKLVKTENGDIVERVWKVGGMYGPALEQVVYWLRKAITVVDTPEKAEAFESLIKYFETGDLATFNEYNIKWLEDCNCTVDIICGFIEVYADPLAKRGTFEAIITVTDPEACKRTNILTQNAQWFEDNSPVMPEHKKKEAKGIQARVVNVVSESGDNSPTSAIGVNLPNADWLRKDYGSKSITIDNLMNAGDQSDKQSGSLQEFSYNQEIVTRAKEHYAQGLKIEVDLHEVLGHGSGQQEPGVGDPHNIIKNYFSAIEEARADLFALYYIADPKMQELGIVTGDEMWKSVYDQYITAGIITQLKRINLGDDIQEAHMRNRQMISKWVYEHGKDEGVIEKIVENNKTYFVVRNYQRLRELFGELLKEIQRVKSQGDFSGAKNLVEGYGVKIDPELHKEVLQRYEALGIKPYAAFINPTLTMDDNGNVEIHYPTNFSAQMMCYGEEFSFLPVRN